MYYTNGNTVVRFDGDAIVPVAWLESNNFQLSTKAEAEATQVVGLLDNLEEKYKSKNELQQSRSQNSKRVR